MAFIVDSESEILKKLLNVNFDWSTIDDYDIIEGLGLTATTLKKNSNRILGKLTLILEKSKDKVQLKDFAKDIGISPFSLSTYKHVEKTFDGIEIPEDVSWTVLLVLARQDNPKKELKHVINEGLSNPEAIKLYSHTKQKEIKRCPKCGNPI